ncbi:hypothetical protein Tco_0125601, partial [Tanacetum coccineum]
MVLYSNIQIANSAAQSNVHWKRVLKSGIKSLSHVDDVPVVETNQHDDVLVVPEPVLEDEDEDPKEEEFEEEDEPQEEKEEDMEVDI